MRHCLNISLFRIIGPKDVYVCCDFRRQNGDEARDIEIKEKETHRSQRQSQSANCHLCSLWWQTMNNRLNLNIDSCWTWFAQVKAHQSIFCIISNHIFVVNARNLTRFSFLSVHIYTHAILSTMTLKLRNIIHSQRGEVQFTSFFPHSSDFSPSTRRFYIENCTRKYFSLTD